MAVAVGTSNVLRKLGADMRWFLEQQGVDPEKARVIIAVEGEPNEVAVEYALKAQFDKDVMTTDDGERMKLDYSEIRLRAVRVHGVAFSVVRIVR